MLQLSWTGAISAADWKARKILTFLFTGRVVVAQRLQLAPNAIILQAYTLGLVSLQEYHDMLA